MLVDGFNNSIYPQGCGKSGGVSQNREETSMNQRNNIPANIANSDLNDSTGRHSILSLIREGMHVHDASDHHIGSVNFVHFGAASEAQQELGTGPTRVTSADDPDMRRDTIIDNIAEAFDPRDLPRELQSKLLMSGFVRVDTAGLFASDRFVTPDQIAGVSGDTVTLSVNRDQLVKRD
jgi:hypothetical protein